jgi:hypothetical protein
VDIPVCFADADELLMLKDYKNNIEIVARELSLNTNLNAALSSSYLSLLQASSFTCHHFKIL